MEEAEFEKSKAFIIHEIIEYVSHSIVIKTIIRRPTGTISATSFDSGEVLTGKVSPFDTYIQIVEGNAEIITDDKSNFLECGQSIVVPAHSPNTIKAKERFKMLSLLIKSGYKEMVR